MAPHPMAYLAAADHAADHAAAMTTNLCVLQPRR